MIERINRIARRVATAEVVAASLFLGKERPTDLFAGAFFDIRAKAKKMKNAWEETARASIEKTLQDDLTGRGMQVADLKVSLGQYRGSRFVTSAKFSVPVGKKAAAEKLVTYLQGKYSPKYKLKSFDEETGVAAYNVR